MAMATIIAINVGFKGLVELFVPSSVDGKVELDGEPVGLEVGFVLVEVGVVTGAVPCRIGAEVSIRSA